MFSICLFENTKHFSKILSKYFIKWTTQNTFQMWTPLKTLFNFLSHKKKFQIKTQKTLNKRSCYDLMEVCPFFFLKSKAVQRKAKGMTMTLMIKHGGIASSQK